MTIVQVEYKTSIYATVDTDLGVVTSVHVMDEYLKPSGAYGECLETIDADLADEAIKIAEKDIWPCWDFGW